MTNEQLTKEIVKLHEQQAEARAEHDKFQVILDELRDGVKENRELTIAVKEIATEMKHLREEQSNMNDRLKVIEEKPLKDYEETKKEIKKNIISFASGVLLTALAIGLGLKMFL